MPDCSYAPASSASTDGSCASGRRQIAEFGDGALGRRRHDRGGHAARLDDAPAGRGRGGGRPERGHARPLPCHQRRHGADSTRPRRSRSAGRAACRPVGSAAISGSAASTSAARASGHGLEQHAPRPRRRSAPSSSAPRMCLPSARRRAGTSRRTCAGSRRRAARPSRARPRARSARARRRAPRSGGVRRSPVDELAQRPRVALRGAADHHARRSRSWPSRPRAAHAVGDVARGDTRARRRARRARP